VLPPWDQPLLCHVAGAAATMSTSREGPDPHLDCHTYVTAFLGKESSFATTAVSITVPTTDNNYSTVSPEEKKKYWC